MSQYIDPGFEMRIPLADFVPNGSQRNALNRNVHVCTRLFDKFTDCAEYKAHDAVALNWAVVKHGHMVADYSGIDDGSHFMAHDDPELGPIAGMFFKCEQNAVVASTFYYNPFVQGRSLGTFTIMRLFQHAMDGGYDYLKLGKCDLYSKSRTFYKLGYQPCELWREHHWARYVPPAPRLNELDY